MFFSDFKDFEVGSHQVLNEDGKIVHPDWKPPLEDHEMVQALKDMLFARTADFMAVRYQRQGRMYTYPPNLGQEAVAVAAGFAIHDEDWLVPAFRELAAWLAKGVELSEIFLYYRGNEEGSRFKNAPRVLPICVPIASQLPHAVGIAFAIKKRKEKSAVFVFVGDGGTSEGDFHEGLNFAAVWNVPVVFIVQNNQFAISVPSSKQTISSSLASKACAYGIPGIRVDGNDFFAMFEVLTEARKHVTSEKGPVLIEALTFRRGAHTTSDDPARYRSKEEEEFWEKRDPVQRLTKFVTARGLWDKKKEMELVAEFKREVERSFEVAENHQSYQLEELFQSMYAETPDDLKNQMIEYRKYIRFKEGLS